MRTIIWVLVFLGIAGIGAGTWLLNSKQKEHISVLESKVSMLNSRLENAEQMVVKLSSQETIVTAVAPDDRNTATIQPGRPEQPVVTREPEPKKTTPQKKAESGERKRPIKKSTAQSARRAARKAQTETRYGTLSTGRWAIYVDSFRNKRHAEITKALFVMRYPSYIVKRGGWYTVYIGKYKNKIDALADLELLQRDYGPSCRIVQG